ncbi:hypothetical protein CFBP6626_07445 [Agrobacterium tumefaciens]|nr:hypothetical protein CFBP6626_07445 [Agrobacterium tumefaciens]CUX07577.1 conserved hypothetical protein [Agrobacterium genomosp. 5 str. CFBP 6626]
MNDAELLKELVDRKALIVHCSRPGKGDEGIGGLLYPDDLRNATAICANESKELCCSVVWPEHSETFGDVGIILKPRSTNSITSICLTDGGTWIDSNTGVRHGGGVPFSREAVVDTFDKATSYNEWTVRDADTIGIFVKLIGRLPEVGKVVDIMAHPDYDEAMGYIKPQVCPVGIELAEIVDTFPNLPVYGFLGTDIIQIGIDINHVYSNRQS